jgi:glycosyltransferase involved in cell wall biosynthesis
MKVYTQDNRGVVNARNRGVHISRGEYVSIVDSDDLLPPGRSEWQVEALDAHPTASLVYGDAWIIDGDGNRRGRFFETYPPIQGDFSCELFANYCFVPSVSVMFRRSAFDEAGPFWGPGPSTDYLKWIELGLLGEAVCLLDKQLGCWRQHGSNVSRQPAERRAEQYENLRKALQKLAQQHPGLADRIGPERLRRRYGRCHLMGAFFAGLENAWSLARSQCAKAFKADPSLVNGLAFLSALPAINLVSALLYRVVAQRLP